MKGLATNSPFPQRPLIWASPPPAGAGRGNSAIAPPGSALPEAPTVGGVDILQAITSVSFGFSYNDGSVTAAFPTATKIAFTKFVTPVGIISVTLSTSLKNATTDGVLGVFVAKDVGSTISLTQNGNAYVEHLVEAGLGHSMRSGMAFSDDIAPRFGSNEQMAIYLCSAGTGAAANRASGVVTVRYFQAT